MPLRTSEAIILRCWPMREADLIVSFFTRDQGKLRGVARRARRPKSNFGAGLERLSWVSVSWYQRETRELVSLNSCELLQSWFMLASNYETSVALDFLAEVSDQMLPPGEVNERQFRLLLAVLEYLRAGGSVWTAVGYFNLWMVRLAGLLPELTAGSESLEIAREMLVTPIQKLTPREWSKETAADLRRFLTRTMEEHVERRFLSAPLMESL